MGHDPYADQRDEEKHTRRVAREAHTETTIKMSTRLSELRAEIGDLKTEERALRKKFEEHQGKWPQ